MSQHSNPLDPSAVLSALRQVLSVPAADSASSASAGTNTLRTPQDGLAAILHAALTCLDFRLVGLAEDDRLSDYQTLTHDSSSSNNALPAVAWNRRGPESYTLRYRHDQSSLTFLLKLLRMSGRVLINASAIEDHKTATIEIPLADYTSASFFPFPTESAASSMQESLVNGFISTSRLNDLLLLFKGSVIQKLIPGLRKDGYQEEPSAELTSSSATGDTSQPAPSCPTATFDPDDDLSLPPRGADATGVYLGRNPMTIGDRDLQPLGGMRPPGFGGFGPPPLFVGAGRPSGQGGGGMYVGPDDPIFRDRFQGGRGSIDGGVGSPRGPWGGDGFLPAGAVPPGARFDPIGPWGSPLPGPGRGAGIGDRGPQGPPGTNNSANRDTDWDDVRPPRGDSDYDNMFM